MFTRHVIGWALAALAVTTGVATRADDVDTSVAAPVPRLLAPGLWFVPGGMRPDRQPDGNSVVFDAPAGLIVIDTGRHAWHSDAILELARVQKKSIVAIVNTHWHLDHVSGNPALRRAFPGLRVHASDAIDDALAGFLARSAKAAPEYLADTAIPASMRDDIRADAASVANGAALKPDSTVTRSGAVTIGGRTLHLDLARDAVTAGDVWIKDEHGGVVVLGDLVTLPVPFLDTACPQQWSAALQTVADSDFTLAIPGHGEPMDRAQFKQYQGAFNQFLACAASDRKAAACAGQWIDAVQPLLSGDPRERRVASSLGEYYVDLLRQHGGRSQYCAATAGK